MISLDDNLISDWKSFDEINKFTGVTHLRTSGNPILEIGAPGNKLGMTGR
jgi:hypothetical protein